MGASDSNLAKAPVPYSEVTRKHVGPWDDDNSVTEIVGKLHSTITKRGASHINRNAVSLAWLTQRFMAAYHPEIRNQKMTTKQVVSQIIIPATAERKCCFTDLLVESIKSRQKGGGKELVSDGHPYFFVVHVWNRPMVDMVDQMLMHAKLEGWELSDTYVWIDIFAINQHVPTLDGTKDDACALIQEVIMDAQATLVIIDVKGEVLNRVWCLWEVWTTLKLKPGGRQAISPLGYGVKTEAFKPIIQGLDVNHASFATSVSSDKTRLLKYVAMDPNGIKGMNLDLKSLFFLLKDVEAHDAAVVEVMRSEDF